MGDDEPQVHPTSVVEDGAAIGSGTRVWHHAHVRAGAVVGARCILGKDVYVDAGARVGDGVKIQNGVSVYDGVTLEDDVFMGPGAVVTNDRVPRSSGDWTVVPTVVGRGASLGANATVVAGCDVGPYALVAAGSVVTRPVGAHLVVAGNPARAVAAVCRCGHTRVRLDANGGAAVACAECGTDVVVP